MSETTTITTMLDPWFKFPITKPLVLPPFDAAVSGSLVSGAAPPVSILGPRPPSWFGVVSIMRLVESASSIDMTVVKDRATAVATPISLLASVKPGVRGCVSNKVKSASTQRIWIAGPTVTLAPQAVPSRV